METFVVELTHKNALALLRELEALDIIRLHKNEVPKDKLSAKFRGILTAPEGDDLEKHVGQMRNEWSNI
jgi:hypothetical protein